jgi:hypothetical protein
MPRLCRRYDPGSAAPSRLPDQPGKIFFVMCNDGSVKVLKAAISGKWWVACERWQEVADLMPPDGIL